MHTIPIESVGFVLQIRRQLSYKADRQSYTFRGAHETVIDIWTRPGRRVDRGRGRRARAGGLRRLLGQQSTTAASSGGGSASSGGGTQLALVAYSTPKKAYDALTTAFGQTSAGKGVTFNQSFGASGSQSRAVDSGQPADVVAFSTTPDVTRLVKDGIVSSSWNAGPQKGISSDSVVVLVVRKGNPKHITRLG